MPRRFLSPAVFALALILSLFGGGLVPAAAQDGGEAPTAQEDPPPPEEGSEPPFGWLQVSAITCTGGGDPGVVTILLASEYAPPGDCVDGYQALLIDGIDYGPVAPYLELQIEAGYHNLYDPSSGASRDVEIYADAVTSVVIVTFAAPEPTTPPEVVPTDEPVDIAAEPTITGLRIVAHACKPDIQTVDQLYALGGVTDRLNACPAFTLPGYPSPGGTVNGGELYFDFTLAPATGDPQSPTGSGSLAADYFCESSVGPLDNDPTNDRCVSTAGFDFQIAEGPITLTQTAIPDTMRYVAAETGSGADAGVIAASDPWSGYLGLDTSLRGTEHPIVHLYYLIPPRERGRSSLRD
ncbi:MAG: hypothetical protein M9947_04450 [Thermomicrobiales bacterium]|nr:hypothetical protein [Thermomicrobiales bacterium]